MAGTRWVRLDTNYFTNPKIVRLSAPAKNLHLAAICWAATELTDGHVPAIVMRRLLFPQAQANHRHVAELVAADLLEGVDGDYQIHDYLVHQMSREFVLSRRQRAAERLAKWRREHGR